MNLPELHPTDRRTCPTDSRVGLLHRTATATALTLMLVLLWCLTHRYLGLAGDAKLYAIQALSRIHPELTRDLFLQNVGQDRFTIFSPFYAWFIRVLGLHDAEMAMTIVCKIWFLAAAWSLARALFSSYTAFLAVASLIVIAGAYGGYDIFH